MKLRIFILTTLFTFFAHAEPAPAVDLNKVCRQTEEGKANLDGATFHLQCRSLERNNFYIATLRADGSS